MKWFSSYITALTKLHGPNVCAYHVKGCRVHFFHCICEPFCKNTSPWTITRHVLNFTKKIAHIVTGTSVWCHKTSYCIQIWIEMNSFYDLKYLEHFMITVIPKQFHYRIQAKCSERQTIMTCVARCQKKYNTCIRLLCLNTSCDELQHEL